MTWKFWNRKNGSNDPLLQVILEKYHLNLLSIPREMVSLGDLYIKDNNTRQISSPGNIAYFLLPKFALLEKDKVTETMADISAAISSKIPATIEIQFLEQFLNNLGISNNIITKLRTCYQSQNVATIRFSFADATRDYVDPIQLGSELTGYKLMKENALYSEGYRYFIVTAVARCSSLRLMAESDNKKAIDIDTEVMGLADASSVISKESSQEGEIVFKGNKRLAFGVELYELLYDTINERLRMKMVDEPSSLRGERFTRRLPKYVYIGDQDSTFFDISQI